MKKLLIVTAVIEVGAGVALICCPSATVALLLGSPLDTPAAMTLGRWPGRRCSHWASPAGSHSTTRRAGLRKDWLPRWLYITLVQLSSSVMPEFGRNRSASPCGRPLCCTRRWPSGASCVFLKKPTRISVFLLTLVFFAVTQIVLGTMPICKQ